MPVPGGLTSAASLATIIAPRVLEHLLRRQGAMARRDLSAVIVVHAIAVPLVLGFGLKEPAGLW